LTNQIFFFISVLTTRTTLPWRKFQGSVRLCDGLSNHLNDREPSTIPSRNSNSEPSALAPDATINLGNNSGQYGIMPELTPASGVTAVDSVMAFEQAIPCQMATSPYD
jgi:hypothetical protein